MAQRYTITQISPKEPRAWAGPHGTIYYRDVKVEGHDRPISVGKKADNALKVGDELYGTISQGDHDVDKFKAEQNPNFGGGGGSKPAGNFGGKTNHTDADTQESIARAVALRHAVVYAVGRSEQYKEDTMFLLADRMLAWLQGSSESTDPKDTTQHPSTTTGETMSQTNPNKPWERITKAQAERDPVQTYQDIASNEQEPVPEWTGE